MDRRVLVTGASRGIGRAIAREFASHGWQTIITARSEAALLGVKEEIERDFCTPCTAVVCDMGDWAAVEGLFSRISALDVLVNNAGISYVGLLSEMMPEDWQGVMNTNLNGCFYTSRLAIPLMLQRGSGRILNISSVWGNVGASMEAAYSASKGGVNALTKALARELAPSNIQVNAIACGVIDTAMNGCLSKEDMAALVEEIPADRVGSPEEVARLVWQTAQAPAYMTGQILTIDGGWT